MSKKSKHKPKGPKNPPQNAQQPKKTEAPKQEVKEPEQPKIAEQPAQVKVERVQQTIQPEQPAQPEKPAQPIAPIQPAPSKEDKPEEKPVPAESVPTKPKRNRNRKKKHGESGVQKDEDVEENNPEEVKSEKPVEPEVKPVEENIPVVEVEPEEKNNQPKSKKDKKKEKNVQKCEQATETHEIKSCDVVPSEKKIEEVVKIEDIQPTVEADSTFIEAKGGKNKKGKNKKGKDNKETDIEVASETPENIQPVTKEDIKKSDEKQSEKSIDKTTDLIEKKPEEKPVQKSVDVIDEKSLEKPIEKFSESVVPEKEQIQQPSTETMPPESAPRNKKGKKGEQSKQQKTDSNLNQSKSESQAPETISSKTENKELKTSESGKPEICPFKTEEKPKSESRNQKKIPESKIEDKSEDDILPALASSIEKTLEQLIVCESDVIMSEQPIIEDDKKEKNKKKSKKDKDKSSEIIEDKEPIIEKSITQSESKVVPSAIDVKTDILTEEKLKPVEESVKEKPEEKAPDQVVQHLIVEEKRATSKSPSRKDKRKKSPRPPKSEEKLQDSKQDNQTIIPQDLPPINTSKEENICTLKEQEIKNAACEKSCENKKKKDKHPSKNTEMVKDEKPIPSSVPEDIINALLSDTPPPFVQESENMKCDIKKPATPIPPAEIKNENKPVEFESAAPSCPIKPVEKAEMVTPEDFCSILKNLPVELPGKIDTDIEKEMKKALEVAIGVIVGGTPIDDNKSVTASEPTTEDKPVTDKPSEEQKTSEKDNQNKQECKMKSKKNKNKQAHDSKTADEKNEKASQKTDVGISPISEVAPLKPIVEQNISESSKIETPISFLEKASSCPLKIQPTTLPDAPSPVASPPVITPSSIETAQFSASPVVTTSLEELSIASSPTNIISPTVISTSDSQSIPKIEEAVSKQSEDNLKQEAAKPPASPKPNKRNKDKKNKQGKGDDSKNTQTANTGQQQQQSCEQTTQTSEKPKDDKKDSGSEKKKDDKKQSDSESHKSESKGAKDSQESPSSGQESKVPGEKFEFLPIPDSCIKGNNTQIQSCESKGGKDKNKKERKSPPKNQPKNLLGPSNIPAKSNKYDYKKEKNKEDIEDESHNAEVKLRNLDPRDVPEPNEKISDANTCILPGREAPSGKKAGMIITELEDDTIDEDEEFVYKYSFRTVFIANACHICKAVLKEDRFVCRFCHLVSYCSEKHRDDDWQIHQSVCYAICTISHAKEQNFIYGDAKSLNGHDYRLLRMQTIVSCEKMLKRKLCPWEQEALLYPRICATPSCREWKSSLLKDCEGCGQVSYCSANPSHLTADHANWCKSYKLYYKLVAYQLNFGRLEPQLPAKIPPIGYQLPDKSSVLFDDLYGSITNVDDCHYATLTQLSTAPLTALYAYQKFMESNNVIKEIMVNGVNHPSKQNFCIHLIGAELQFEGDTLKKWEVFFLHLMHHVKELTVVLIGPELNTSKLPVELLSKIKLCHTCRQADRKIKFDFIENSLYHDYVESQKFIRPDIICAFNPGFHRATGYAGMDTWPETIASALRLRVPICGTAYTSHEMPRDLERVKACAPNAEKLRVVVQPQCNPYASLRPDRNFVSDDEMPLIFKNYHFMVITG